MYTVNLRSLAPTSSRAWKDACQDYVLHFDYSNLDAKLYVYCTVYCQTSNLGSIRLARENNLFLIRQMEQLLEKFTEKFIIEKFKTFEIPTPKYKLRSANHVCHHSIDSVAVIVVVVVVVKV